MRVGKQWVVASVNGDDDKCGSVVVGFVEVYKAVMMLVVVVVESWCVRARSCGDRL